MRQLLTVVFTAFASLAVAQQPEQIIIVGVVPSGAGIDKNKIPFPVQTANAEALENTNSVSLADFLRQNFTSISLNDAQNNPLQSDLQYRGFTASPLLGLAQGIAVYQNGARINEPLGDTVNWDLLPQSAIHGITLSGGANPLFGLNSLGGSLVVAMKDGYTFQGTEVEASTGAFGRRTVAMETGGSVGNVAYYGNLEYLEEDGWRDHSESEVLGFYGSVDWRSEASRIGAHLQLSDSDLIGNGSAPVELLELDRAAVFTGPDITANELQMLSIDFTHDVHGDLRVSGNAFYRRNDTDSFNGDVSEFALCDFGSGTALLENLEEDDLAPLGLEFDGVCDGQFADFPAFDTFLGNLALQHGVEAPGVEDLSDVLSGTGALNDSAINNLSARQQTSQGGDIQLTWQNAVLGYPLQVILGAAYFNGESQFDAVLELSAIDPRTRLTRGLGTGTFVDSAATNIDTVTRSTSLYGTSAIDLNDVLTLTLSARANETRVTLQDRSGVHPELNGRHRYARINPAVGLTWQLSDSHNVYLSYSESSRAPTPIELACNEGVFDLAVAYAVAAGETADDVDFECRLPNAFLADPPLDAVVAHSFELGARGFVGDIDYSLGLFATTNHNDILFQTTGRATGLFANVDKTRRRGLEAGFSGTLGALHWSAGYSLIEATFEADFQALSPNHSFADDAGEIAVRYGDHIPGIPRHQFKASGDYQIRESLSVGLDVVSNSSQFLRGDESNQLASIDGYTVVNLRTRYELGTQLELFAKVENLFDTDYESFGLLGEDPGEAELPVLEDFSVPYFLGAGQPRAAFIGVRYRFRD